MDFSVQLLHDLFDYALQLIRETQTRRRQGKHLHAISVLVQDAEMNRNVHLIGLALKSIGSKL
jgi:hypothetical protein